MDESSRIFSFLYAEISCERRRVSFRCITIDDDDDDDNDDDDDDDDDDNDDDGGGGGDGI